MKRQQFPTSGHHPETTKMAAPTSRRAKQTGLTQTMAAIGSSNKTVRRLFELVVSKKKTDDPLGPDSPQPPELGLLLEKCGEETELLAVSCCEAVVQLVLLGHVDPVLALSGLLNAVPSARSLVGIGGALSDLMVSQLIAVTEASTEPYTCPYGIRSRPHPYISLVTTRADSWPVLLRQVQRVLRWPLPCVQQHAVALLQAFLRFVLLEPPTSQQFLQLRLSLPRLLLASSRVKATQLQAMDFLEDAASCLQVKTAAQVGEAWAFLDQLSGALLDRPARLDTTEHVELRGQVAGHCLGLAGEAGRLGVDTEGLIETAARLLKAGVAPGSIARIWLLTGQLILQAAERHTSHLLHIVRLCFSEIAALPRPLVAAVVLPLLHATSAPPRVGTEKRAGAARAARLLQDVSGVLAAAPREDPPQSRQSDGNAFCITPEGATLDVYNSLASRWASHPPACLDWLEKVEGTLGTSSSVPDHVTVVVAGVCVWSSDRAIIRAALSVIAKISTLVPEKAGDFLPLFMFCLGFHADPTLRLVFLEAMPKAATHKVSIAPTLKTLQLLAETSSLRPVALRLVTALWKQQDRCFPYLQRMLQSAQPSAPSLESGVDEFLVAKAACIRDICEERPHQHGADMLAPLSAILNDCTRDETVVPACLALEGLVALCEAEVVDIRTVWAVLAPKLSADPRPQVVRRICELFSLVPSLSINSEDYEDFKQQTLRSLWKRVESPDGVAASAAYRALTSFSPADFVPEVLPKAVTGDVRIAEDVESVDAEPQETPGICFLRLLELTKQDVLPAYGDLLVWLVSEEVKNLPRGVYHSALSRKTTRPSADKALSTLPDLLLSRYEKVKQPGLRASLAAGLLFSYDVQLEAGRDGRVRRPAIVSHGRAYHQKLYSLLQEVMLQPSDWHCCMAIPRAWVSFMDRCYNAYLQSRRAELAMSLDQGQVNDPEEHELLTNTAWLWARDKLTDLIKSASRGGPSVQANCVLALAGLAVTTTRYSSGLDELGIAAAKEATEHLGHAHWLGITVNTLLSVLDPAYQPSGRVFSMCQQHPGQSLSAATALARGAACLALPLLVPIMLTVNTTAIHQAIESLTRQLPGHASNKRESVSAPLFAGLGLGTLLARLLDEQFAHVAGNEGKTALWKAVKDLEEGSFNDSDYRQGCLLGLAVCIPALCKDGRGDTRAHLSTLKDKLTDTMASLDAKDMSFTAATLCVAVLAVATYVTGQITADDVNTLVAKVHDAHCDDVNDGGLAVALAGMCHGLGVAGHPTIGQLAAKLQGAWIACLQQADLSTLQRLCVLHGLLSLAGADSSLFLAAEEGSEEAAGAVTVNDAVHAVTHTPPGDLGLQTAANWRLGQLYMEVGTKSATNASVPSSFQYLPDTSVIRPVVDRLIQAGKSSDLTEAQALPLLRCLVEGPSSRPLPPVNWTTLLSPILRLNLGESVTVLCLQLAVRQSASAPTASLLLASYMLPPLWNSLQETSRIVIFDNMATIIKSISAPKLREFLTKSLLEEFPAGGPGVQAAACGGLRAALQVPDPPQAVTLALYQALEQLYHQVPNEAGLYGLVAECLREVPDHLVDSITKDDFNDGISFIKSSFTRCYLVSLGSQPLAWLNPAIAMALWESDSTLLYNSEPKGVLLELVVHCFYQFRLSQSDTTSTAKFSQWLLELMGHVRSVANGNTSPPEGATVSAKTVEFGMLVFAAVVVMMSGCGSTLVIPTVSMAEYRPTDHYPELLVKTLTTLLPEALRHMVEKEQWKRLNGKIIDWLISMYNIPTMNELPEWQCNIKGCIRALRHTVDFRKMATWSQAYML